jgi:hypothetical protein
MKVAVVERRSLNVSRSGSQPHPVVPPVNQKGRFTGGGKLGIFLLSDRKEVAMDREMTQ